MKGVAPTKEAKVKLLKERLRVCWWGPQANIKYEQHGWEGVQDSNGFAER